MTTDDATTLRIARLLDVTENLTHAIAGLDRLDDERKADIDELREEVAALGAKVDALGRATQHSHSLPRKTFDTMTEDDARRRFSLTMPEDG